MKMKIDRAIRTGIPLIDNQHDAYVKLVDEFFEMADQGNVDRDELVKAVDGVIKYAVEHFDAEEHLMRSIEYPYYEEHLNKHNFFRSQTDSYVKEVRETSDINTCTVRLSKWLVGWLCEQVQDDDLKLANYMRNET